MKFEILFVIFVCLILKRFCEMCEMSGEKCACKIDSMTTEMSCLEKSLTRTILNLNEIFISENVTILNIKI